MGYTELVHSVSSGSGIWSIWSWCIWSVVGPILSGVYGVGASMTVGFGVYGVGAFG